MPAGFCMPSVRLWLLSVILLSPSRQLSHEKEAVSNRIGSGDRVAGFKSPPVVTLRELRDFWVVHFPHL